MDIDVKISKITKEIEKVSDDWEILIKDEARNIVMFLMVLEKPIKNFNPVNNIGEFREYYEKLSKIFNMIDKFHNIFEGANYNIDDSGVTFSISLYIRKDKRNNLIKKINR